MQREALRARGPLLARRRPALRGRVGGGSLPRHLSPPRLRVRPRDGPAALAARLRAGRDVSGDGRGRRRPGRGDRDIAVERCWETGAPLYNAYHDEEWGRPVRDERGLYERLCLEGFQSGLSWLTILRKREPFRHAFAGFDPEQVARFGTADVDRLLGDAGIVRHRGKIEATIANAHATLALRKAGTPKDEVMWEYRDAGDGKELSRRLKAAGFRFVGPPTVYSSMEGCGIVNGHRADCWVRDAVEAERA